MTFISTIEKIGLQQWEAVSFSNKLCFIKSNINDFLTAKINVSTSGKCLSTSRRSSFYKQIYLFLLLRRLFSTSGKPVLKCSELCFSLQILTIEKFSLIGKRSLFLQLIFTNSHVNDFLTITTFPLSGNIFHK